MLSQILHIPYNLEIFAFHYGRMAQDIAILWISSNILFPVYGLNSTIGFILKVMVCCVQC